MKVIQTDIPDVLIIEPQVFEDSRGFFFESFNHSEWEKATGLQVTFVQENHSCSRKGVLRGLHYQIAPHCQGKLVRCVAGEVWDVAVDLRRSSPTFGQWVGCCLSDYNRRQLWIPEGFAHGFVTLTEKAEFLYKTTNYYAPEAERCICWNDPELNIHWPLDLSPILSEKDLRGCSFSSADTFF